MEFVNNKFDKSIIRCKGVLYFSDEVRYALQEYIAEKEDIIVSEKEYEEKTTELAAMYGETSVEGFIQSYESIYGEGYTAHLPANSC